jgi:putative zinc finger/helix-turn-helix YgiT family protein
MKCFKCAKGKLTRQTADIAGEVRGEKITVRCECTMCNRCGFQVLSEEQSNDYTVASSDAYREKHGLLTSKELKDIRRRLRLSQQEFATFLKVGVASVKRWEAGLIQDEALDLLIRLRTDLDVAQNNVRELKGRLDAPSSEQTQATVVTVHSSQSKRFQWTSELPSIAHVKTDTADRKDLCYRA